jgi:import inner membrane translocase subunit TIM21
MKHLLRACRLARTRPLCRAPALSTTPFLLPRRHATTTHQTTPGVGSGAGVSAAKRRVVTPFNDDGAVPWSELSIREKAARSTQQTFNFGLAAVGLLLTVGVGYILWTEVFAPESRTNQFNRAVKRIKNDPRCIKALGDPRKMVAHGDTAWSSMRRPRDRPVKSTITTDAQGAEHLKILFYVDGPRNYATVNLHLVRRAGQRDFDYKYFYLDVPEHDRIWLENADPGFFGGKREQLRFLGIKWK